MEYIVAAVLVLLLIAGFVTFMVLNATRKSGSAGPSDPGAEGNPAGIVAPDSSPLGDTAEHAGEQSGGETRVREGERVELAVTTKRLHFFDPETGRGVYDGAPGATT